ncbi:MAG TPA: ubiquinone biosynthesis protein UbiE, partial [Dehalococcoidia bacterium]|nr:ubiquinone biosynthesis protein UbiE [Dehalococcoidia bacterium]
MAERDEMAVFDTAKARLLEVRYATPPMIERRRAVLEALAVIPGERAIDVGTGPGFLACDLVGQVGPTGRVAAVDQSAEMVDF